MSSHNPNMSDQITRGCVPRLVGGENIANPVVQVTSIKKIEPAGNGNNLNGPDRYRVLLSDGDHIVQGMLATQKNEVSQLIYLVLKLDSHRPLGRLRGLIEWPMSLSIFVALLPG